MKEPTRIMLEALKRTENKHTRKVAGDILANRHMWYVTQETPAELATRGFFGVFMQLIMRGDYKAAYQAADAKDKSALRAAIELDDRRWSGWVYPCDRRNTGLPLGRNGCYCCKEIGGIDRFRRAKYGCYSQGSLQGLHY